MRESYYSEPLKQSIWIQKNAGRQEDVILNGICSKSIKILDIILNYSELEEFYLEKLKEYLNEKIPMHDILIGLNYLVEYEVLFFRNEKYLLNHCHHVVSNRRLELDDEAFGYYERSEYSEY